MRVTRSRHGETRDCLAREWASYMASTLPEVSWVPLPNVGQSVVEQAAQWRLDGFIFSGGNDVGQYPERDATEHALLEYTLKHNLPVFGVCRGLQYLQKYLGGTLERCSHKNHVATQHEVSLSSDRLEFDAPPEAIVNSHHEWAVSKSELASQLEILAVSEDGWVEALRRQEPFIKPEPLAKKILTHLQVTRK